MYDYGIMNELVAQDKRNMICLLDISKPGNPNGYDRKPFTRQQVDTIWAVKDSVPH